MMDAPKMFKAPFVLITVDDYRGACDNNYEAFWPH